MKKRGKKLKVATSSIYKHFYTIKQHILATLLVFFLFATFHYSLHNDFDHKHNEHCTIYVLEQLFFSADIVEFKPLEKLFLPFIFISFVSITYFHQERKRFSIRAPPFL